MKATDVLMESKPEYSTPVIICRLITEEIKSIISNWLADTGAYKGYTLACEAASAVQAP